MAGQATLPDAHASSFPTKEASLRRGTLKAPWKAYRIASEPSGTAGPSTLIERLWRTLKGPFHFALLSLAQGALEERLAYAVLHYNFFRPHSALEGDSPAEAFFCCPAAHEWGASPPRGAWGRKTPGSPFRIDLLDPQQTYPVLTKAACAKPVDRSGRPWPDASKCPIGRPSLLHGSASACVARAESALADAFPTSIVAIHRF